MSEIRRYRWRAAAGAALVLCASLRVWWLEGRHDLNALAERLRRVRTFLLRWDPELFLALIDRLHPYLPPWTHGRCIKRSLLLLDLWSRCGLEPRIHFGLRAGGGRREAHAWVTAGGIDSENPRPNPPVWIETWAG